VQENELIDQENSKKSFDKNTNSINYNKEDIKKNSSTEILNKNIRENVEITEKTLIDECLDSFFKSGITKWNLHHHRAYGIACSLYEINPLTLATVGEPIADTYAILTRRKLVKNF
jgi:hypothetical protein